MSQSNNEGYYGSQDVNAATDEYNATSFVIAQILAGRNYATIVQIVAVDTDAQSVDVQPLVNQLDGAGNAIPHGVVHGLQYVRVQGGVSAIILDPVIGDMGVAIFADRDISSVKANKAISNPGSGRRADMADGMYMGGMLNAEPEQYVQFDEDGITISSPNTINLEASSITFAAPTITMNASTSITATTPTFTINGALHTTGAATSDVSVTAPLVTGTTDVVFAGHGAVLHIHTGGTILGKTGPTV